MKKQARLVLEGAGKKAAIAWYEDLEHSPVFMSSGSSAHELTSLIQEEMKSKKLSWDSLDAIVCGVGPGSYTGLRVAQAIAQGLCAGLNLPLYGVSSLLAYSAEKEKEVYWSVLDARSGGVYVQKKNKGDSVEPAQRLSIKEWEEKLKELPKWVSPDEDKLKQRLAQSGGNSYEPCRLVFDLLPLYKASLLPHCSKSTLKEGFQGIKLNYLRLTQPEEEQLKQ